METTIVASLTRESLFGLTLDSASESVDGNGEDKIDIFFLSFDKYLHSRLIPIAWVIVDAEACGVSGMTVSLLGETLGTIADVDELT